MKAYKVQMSYPAHDEDFSFPTYEVMEVQTHEIQLDGKTHYVLYQKDYTSEDTNHSSYTVSMYDENLKSTKQWSDDCLFKTEQAALMHTTVMMQQEINNHNTAIEYSEGGIRYYKETLEREIQELAALNKRKADLENKINSIKAML